MVEEICTSFCSESFDSHRLDDLALAPEFVLLSVEIWVICAMVARRRLTGRWVRFCVAFFGFDTIGSDIVFLHMSWEEVGLSAVLLGTPS